MQFARNIIFLLRDKARNISIPHKMMTFGRLRVVQSTITDVSACPEALSTAFVLTTNSTQG